MPTNEFSIGPLKAQLLAGERKATELGCNPGHKGDQPELLRKPGSYLPSWLKVLGSGLLPMATSPTKTVGTCRVFVGLVGTPAWFSVCFRVERPKSISGKPFGHGPGRKGRRSTGVSQRNPEIDDSLLPHKG